MLMIIPPKRLILMQGIPGSGKTTIANTLLTTFVKDSTSLTHAWSAVKLSTDDYREKPCGHYVHDISQNAAHHAKTQRACVDEMIKETNLIIIDNTNIEKWQAAPYLALASMYGYEVQVVSIQCSIADANQRNNTRDPGRRVPSGVIEAMHEKMEVLL